MTCFISRKQHISGLIQRKLDCFFISNQLQESVNKDVLKAFFTVHSPLLFPLDLCKVENRGKGLWKFNNSLSMNANFVTKMEFHIKATLETLQKGTTDFQAR